MQFYLPYSLPRICCAFAIIALLSLPGCDDASDAGSVSDDGRPTVLRFADTGIEGTEELRRTYGEFVAVMEEILEVKVEFFSISNRTIAATALQHGQVDLVLAGPTEYLFIKSRQDVFPLVGIEREKYYSAFFVPQDSPAKTLDDLRGKKIAMKNIGSTSGHVIPTAMLIDAGLDPEKDVDIQLLDAARIEALLNGEVDALGDGIRVWEEHLQRRAPGRFRIIAQSESLPRDLLVARQGLPEAFVEEMREKMLANSDRIMAAILSPGARVKYEGAAFVTVSDSDYDVLRRTHEALGMPYDR